MSFNKTTEPDNFTILQNRIGAARPFDRRVGHSLARNSLTCACSSDECKLNGCRALRLQNEVDLRDMDMDDLIDR
jgi:hypothetical protein